jgi:transposase
MTELGSSAPTKDTAAACCVSDRTVQRALKQPQSTAFRHDCCKPPNPKKPPNPEQYISMKIAPPVQDEIRVLIHQEWTQKGLGPTVDEIRKAILSRFDRKDMPYTSDVSFRLLLRAMGFRHTKMLREWIVFQQPYILKKRAEYLDRKQEYDKRQAKFYWLDETWLDENHHCKKRWTDMKLVHDPSEAKRLGIIPTMTKVISRGKRLIVLHTMGEDGWVDGGLWTNATKGQLADYHQDMNADAFEEYLRQLCPKLGKGAVLIMDNASYHTRNLFPMLTQASRYDAMTTFCDEHGINYPVELATTDRRVPGRILKDAFWRHWVKPHLEKQPAMYAAEAIASEFGVEILRLPPYHCFFNPIEMAWGVVKGQVAKKNSLDKVAKKLDLVKELLNDELNAIPKQHFINWVRHTKEKEDKYRSADAIEVHRVQPLIIPYDNDDSDEDDEDEDALDADDDDFVNIVD